MRRYKLILSAVTAILAGCAVHHTGIESASEVKFYLNIPGARSVSFASSLDAFQLHETVRISKTKWGITVPAWSEFTYFYVVDGSVFLPECRFQERDDFGSKNCIYVPVR